MQIEEMPRLPLGLRALILVCSSAAVVMALIVLGLAFANTQNGARMAYDTLGFELLTVFAGLFGIFIGLGWYRAGPAVALLCVAGAVGVGALLGLLGSDASYHGLPRLDVKVFNGVSMVRFRDVGLLVAGGLTVSAFLSVLIRRPRESFRAAAIGMALALPAIIITGTLWSMRSSMANWAPAAQGLAVVFGGLFVLAFVAASTHMIAKAFELGGQDHRASTAQ